MAFDCFRRRFSGGLVIVFGYLSPFCREQHRRTWAYCGRQGVFHAFEPLAEVIVDFEWQ